VGKIIKPRRRETVLSVTLHWSDCKAVTPESQTGVGTAAQAHLDTAGTGLPVGHDYCVPLRFDSEIGTQ